MQLIWFDDEETYGKGCYNYFSKKCKLPWNKENRIGIPPFTSIWFQVKIKSI